MRGLPSGLSGYIDSITIEELGNCTPNVEYYKVEKNRFKVIVSFELHDSLVQNDWQVNITPSFDPTFNWASHLTPGDNHIIAQHVFRAPTIIVSDSIKQLTVIPDLDVMQKGSPVNWYMDLNAEKNLITLGMSKYKVREHVLFERDEGAIYPPGNFSFSFYILLSDQKEHIDNPFRGALSFFWDNWGKPLYEEGLPVQGNLETYVEHTYKWAFDTWKDAVWQEFDVNGKKVGAPGLVVYVSQSENYPGTKWEPDVRAVFNQAWYSVQRSANGLMRYVQRTGNKEWLDYAKMTKEFSISVPVSNGLFYSVAATEMESFTLPENNKTVKRSAGWETLYWGNSRYFPGPRQIKNAPFHILDMSWTCSLLLEWYSELEKDERILKFTKAYADKLLELQDADGFFPAWIGQDGNIYKELIDSPENAMSATFLLRLYSITQDETYKMRALRALNAIRESAVKEGRWEDFETYWSCSRWGTPGVKVKRNNMYKKNTLSMYYAAEAFLEAYRLTNNMEYLETGQKCLDELLMFQSVWQPPFMDVNVFGGFGVMNGDGEWLDARQSLFAELIIRYGEELDIKEYYERGVSALKASFSMMYCPENISTKERYESKFPFFNDHDYGFTTENYGHGGSTEGIGPFTVFTWGNGAAAEAYNRIVDRYGKDFIEHPPKLQ